MRIAVLGAGAMGGTVARLLARRGDVELLVLDADAGRAEHVAASIGRGPGRGFDADGGTAELAGALQGTDAVAACLPYRLNLAAMGGALEARVPYADLGGLYHMTLRQLELDGEFRDAGVPALLGVGACPGLSNVMARLASERLDAVRSIDILDGATVPEAAFGIPYSAETILDEYTLDAMVFEDGELRKVPAGSGAIRYEFPEPVGEMEAVYTLHSEIATLPRTINGVRDVRWRLALPPALHDGFRLLSGLGLASTDLLQTRSGTVAPRDVLRALFARIPVSEEPPEDVEFLDVRAVGTRAGRPTRFLGRARFDPQPEGIGGGAFGTSAPMAVAARWLAEGRVPPGIHPPESALDPVPFLEELAGEGMRFTLTVEESLGP
jgi:lysine 6-dehydrogenase